MTSAYSREYKDAFDGENSTELCQAVPYDVRYAVFGTGNKNRPLSYKDDWIDNWADTCNAIIQYLEQQ